MELKTIMLTPEEKQKRTVSEINPGYALFVMAHSNAKSAQAKTIESMKTRRVTDVPRATTARSRSSQFVW